jgi:hypothetical protein
MLLSLCGKVPILKTNLGSRKENIRRGLWWILRNMKFLQTISLLQIILTALFPLLIHIILERVQLNLLKLYSRLSHQEAARIKSLVEEKAMMLTILKKALGRLNISKSLKKFFLSKDLRLMCHFSQME